MTERNIFAGFGGQGVLLMGQLLAQAGMSENKHTSWIPSYGPEMRGGTANCSVMISDDEIDSPLVSKATAVIAMNRPSLDKFEASLEPGGKLFVNSSIIDRKAARDDVQVYYIPCNEIAGEIGNNKVANMVMLGAYIERSGCVDKESILAALSEKLGEGKAHLIPLNRLALEKGAQAAR